MLATMSKKNRHMAESTTTIQIVMLDRTIELLDSFRKKRGMSRAEVIRECIFRIIDKNADLLDAE